MSIQSMYPQLPLVDDGNIHNLIFRHPGLATLPDFTRYIDASTGRRYSYRDFLESVYDSATALGTPVSEGGLGLRAEDGEIVGILSDNCVEYIVLLHALLAITVPFSLLSSYSTPFELEHALRLSDVTCLFVHPSLLSTALSTVSKVGISHSKIYILGGHVEGRMSLADMIDNVRTKHIPRLEVRPAKRDTLAYMVFSSGTSGLPKAVMISHGNLISTLLQMAVMGQEMAKAFPPEVIEQQSTSVILAFLPLYHTYGLHAFAFRNFMQQNTLVLIPRWNVEQALRAIPRYKITFLALIPSAVYQIVNYLRNHEVDLSTVQVISSGAAHLPHQLADRLLKAMPENAQLMQGYGLSELTFSAMGTPFPGMFGGRAKPTPKSTGVLLPGMEARIVRDDGSDAAIGEPGHLYLKGGNVAIGYRKNPEANAQTFVDGWARTGDRFWVDEHGNFFFDDRTKDTLKISGIQVSPAELEDVLLKHPDELILDVTVAGVNGGRTSDEKIPRAWIVLSEVGKQRGPDAVVEALDLWTQKNLSKYKWLRGGIEIVDEIPKSPTGKVLRRVLQDRHETSQMQLRGKL